MRRNAKLVRTALLTLTDPDLTDRTILNVIYGLAIQYRLGVDAAQADAQAVSRGSRPGRRRPRGPASAASGQGGASS